MDKREGSKMRYSDWANAEIFVPMKRPQVVK